MLRRLRLGLAALAGISGVGLAAVSCGGADTAGYYDPGYVVTCQEWTVATCETTADCYDETRYVYELGTQCINGHCLCPVEGWVMCNKRGHPPDNNMRQCWPREECEAGEYCIQEAPPPPPPPEPECTADDLSKCPGPVDKRCGVATCNDGVCGVQITPGPIASQKVGDCKQSVCTFDGKAVEEEDASDYYDDGEQCTFDYCNITGTISADMVGIQCPDTGEGFCSQGQCVQCLQHSDCGPDVCNLGHCMPLTCANGMKDGAAESDIDCGGECLPCSSGKACMVNADCASNLCKDLQCQAPTCDDNEKNDGETDKDCGAKCKDPAKLCGDGQGCKAGADCESGVCFAGKCQAPSCTDGVQNQGEAGVDCGEPCDTDC
jgi:hypothetical protein